jgi:hypothetical protein
MADWFVKSLAGGKHDINAELFLILGYRLGLAFVLGCVVAGIYQATQKRAFALTSGFVLTLVLLSVLIAVVTQVIGENFARAFSLVGVLGLVRFRTIMEDVRDTAFVIFAVVIGMAVGADHLIVALLGLLIGGLAAFLIQPRSARLPEAATDWTLNLRVGVGHNPDSLLSALFTRHFTDSTLLTTATGRQGAALDLTYRVRMNPLSSPIGVVGELNQIEGVQNVELRRS